MSKVWLVHGAFNRGEGKAAWDTLRPALREWGLEPVNFSYGWVGPLTTRRRSRKAAAKLAEKVKPDDAVVGFSNGGLVLAHLLEEGVKPRRTVLIQPALEASYEFPYKKGVLVLYNSRDWAVSVSILAFWHGWGRMGRVGPQDNVMSWDTRQDGQVKASGHFGWRKCKAGEYWSHKIAQEIQA